MQIYAGTVPDQQGLFVFFKITWNFWEGTSNFNGTNYEKKENINKSIFG